MLRLVVAELAAPAPAGRLDGLARALLEAGHEVVLVHGVVPASASVVTVEQEDADALVLLVAGAVAEECATVLDLLDLLDSRGAADVRLVVVGLDTGRGTLEQRGAQVFGAAATADGITAWVDAHLVEH